MNKRSWWKYCTPLLALLVAGGSLYLNMIRKSESSLSVKHLLPDFPEEAPVKIEISWRAQKTTLQNINGEWLVAERENHPADLNMVAKLLEDIRKIRPLRRAVPADRETCSRLRVNPVEEDPSEYPGMRIRISDSNGTVLRDLTFGYGYYGVSMQPGKDPHGRWLGIVLDDGKRVIPFLVSSVFEEYHPVTGGWMSVPFFDNSSQMVRAHFSSREKDVGSWLLARLSPEEPFTVVIPENGTLDPEKFRQWVSLTGGRFIYDGIPEKDCGELTEIGLLNTVEKSGLQRSLTFYRSPVEKRGVLCRVGARYRGNDPIVKKRMEYFIRGRRDWLYLIPADIYETIRRNPAGKE